jgi:hypothetical protein
VRDIFHYKGQLPLLGYINLENTSISKLNLDIKDCHLNEEHQSLIDNIPSKIEFENKGIKENNK